VTRHLAIVGPTATGKSALALALAATLGDAEIVSLDSMQVYRGMDIGTAKPTLAERAAVPHHLIDVADPGDEWSVRATQQGARTAIDDIEARGKRAILVGGTGLYVRAVVDGLDVPATDPSVRAAIDESLSTADAYARLLTLDPVAAARVQPENRRRIVRALEVIELTGRLFSSFGNGLTEYEPPALDVSLIGLTLPAPDLGRRIVQRIAAMRAAGLVDEVRGLLDRPQTPSRTARQAIGYQEVADHLEGLIPSVRDAFDLVERRTRKFARRQRVWFARDPRIAWLPSGENPGGLLGAVLARWVPTTSVVR
jgi:tRNA dimethylallyltransferase